MSKDHTFDIVWASEDYRAGVNLMTQPNSVVRYNGERA
jgi:hypothetical protein